MSEDAKPAEPKKATLKAAKPKIDIVKDDKDAVLARLYRGIPLRVKDMTTDRDGDHEDRPMGVGAAGDFEDEQRSLGQRQEVRSEAAGVEVERQGHFDAAISKQF